MSEIIIVHSVNNRSVSQRQTNGYINATQLCKAAGKKWNDYLRNQTTQEYLQALSENLMLEITTKNPVAGIPATALIQVFQGINHAQQGTWIHPQVAIHLGMWLNPQFAVQVTQWVVEYMTGTENLTVETWTPPAGYPEITEQTFKALPPLDQDYLTETARQRKDRQIRESLEINEWLERCYKY